jgi:large subunit ribosomal protein L22
MAFGVKTNERPGVRSQVRHVRSSAYKAREMLDLIRGLPVARALEVLEFAERDIARIILKCLESAIANAEHNNAIPADELFVSACFADEGPTLKRWRPRARGRATRIRKRTCHITVIVSRLDPADLAALREREAATGAGRTGRAAAEARRERVARSRQAKAERKVDEHDHDHDDHDHDHDDEAAASTDAASDAEAVDAEVVDSVTETAAPADEAAVQDAPVTDEAAPADEVADEATEAEGKDS